MGDTSKILYASERRYTKLSIWHSFAVIFMGPLQDLSRTAVDLG